MSATTSSSLRRPHRLCRHRQLILDERPDLKFKPYNARFPERIRDHGGDCFAAIRQKDIIVHHPYESFDVVVQFIRQAARRSRRRRHQADALPHLARQPDRRGARQGGRGRQVGDGAGRAQGPLRRGGQHPVGARPRARRRAGGLRLHRAQDPRQGVDGGAPRGRPDAHLRPFRHRQLPSGHRQDLYRPVVLHHAIRRCAATPRGCSTSFPAMPSPRSSRRSRSRRCRSKRRLLEHIEEEIAHAKAGRPAQIWAKLNSLVDPEHHRRALSPPARPACRSIWSSAASAACGPACRGSPTTSGSRASSAASSSMRASSASAAATACRIREARVYISSADWMPRNLDRRVETLVPDREPDRARAGARPDHGRQPQGQPAELGAPGRRLLAAHRAQPGEEPFNAHEYFMNNPSLSGRGSSLKDRLPPEISGDISKKVKARK